MALIVSGRQFKEAEEAEEEEAEEEEAEAEEEEEEAEEEGDTKLVDVSSDFNN
jgi:hypothetical protein